MAEDMKVQANWIDKTVGFISPRAGKQRLEARRSYEAASNGRRTKSFSGAQSTGPNIEVSQSFVKLRARSRHFVRNNGWAKRALVAICDNTIGQGIRPAPIGTKPQIKKIKGIWKQWAETTACDWNGKSTFYGLQELIMSEIAEAGDCLVIRRKVIPTRQNPIPIQLQVLEGDQLDHSRDYPNDKGYARLGVQHSFEGKVTGYWILAQHPNDMTGVLKSIQSEFVPVEDVIHPFEILRAGQVRGVPMGVAGFMKMADFSDYEDAQLLKQKVAASYCGFVSGATDAEKSDPIERLEPGMMFYLNDGETVSFPASQTADGYDPYSKKILQGIAAAYGITYEMLTMDYSNVNFTSGRMGKIDTIGRFKKWQYNMFVPQVCVPVWNWFMEGAIIAGLTNVYSECQAQDWTAPKIPMIDPGKETAAQILAIQGGTKTWSEAIREMGGDPETFIDEYKRDFDKMKEYGLTFTSMPLAIPKENPNNGKDDTSK